MKAELVALGMAAVALAMAGCSNDENEGMDNWNGEIRLSSGVSTQTRAFSSMDTQLPEGRTVAVYVDKAGGSRLYGNNVLTADGNGSFTYNEPMYFPEDKSAVDIYAFHTNGTLNDDFPETIIHEVESDQSSEASYLKSDLLYAASQNNAFSKTAIPLTFYHMLSKVQVAIKAGAGFSDLDLEDATVSIVGIKLKADFTPDKSVDINNATSGTAQDARAKMIDLTASDDNLVADMYLSNDVTTGTGFSNAVYNDAIIVPQTVESGRPFVQVILPQNRGVLTHKLDSDVTFKSGMKYQYQITVNLTGLTVNSTVTDWESEEDPIQGSAGMD